MNFECESRRVSANVKKITLSLFFVYLEIAKQCHFYRTNFAIKTQIYKYQC
jgi:hypothetical protein